MPTLQLLLRVWETLVIIIGIMMATVPVLLTKAPINDVANMTRMNALTSFPFAIRDMLLPADCANPVCRIAPPTTKSPTIITTIGDEKPLKASLVVSTPVAVSIMRADNATTSPLTLPQINMAMVTINTVMVMVILLLWLWSCGVWGLPGNAGNPMG